MASPTDRRSTLSSATRLFHSEVDTVPCGEDTAASICAHLLVHGGLSRTRLAHALGLPSLAIEEAIKNGVSSVMLRGQLLGWLHEAGATPAHEVPEELLTRLQKECAVDEVERQQQQRRSGVLASYGDGSVSFAALDPVSQRHFNLLRQSVGHSFISILNDPGEPTTSAGWGTWVGGKLYNAFDFNGRVGTLEEIVRAFREAQVGPDSATGLLTEYPPNQDFSAYVKLISEVYQTNRREGIVNDAAEWRGDGDGVTADKSSTEFGISVTADGGPWPRGVPGYFFRKDYSTATEMVRLSEEVGESESSPVASSFTKSVTASPADAVSSSTRAGTAAAADSNKELAMPSLSYIVDATTFTNDFEYLEARNKELRAWESAVERCLLQHVKHRSEDFFATSQQFGALSSDAREVLVDARVAREGGMRAGEHFVSEYLRIGQLFRRRQNFVELQRTATLAQRVLRRLRDVENWAALPERDFAEVLTITSALADLEAAGRTIMDSETSISWATLSQLRCLAEVPARVKAARKTLETVVLDEYASVLLSDLSSSDAGDRVRSVCTAVTRLGILNTANQRYHTHAVTNLQAAAQEALVGLFMNTGSLDDAKANELLAVAGDANALALPDARQQLLAFAKGLRFPAYVLILQQFVDVLVDAVTQMAQNWGFFVMGGLRRALAMFEDQDQLVQQATHNLLSRVCAEGEALVASLLEVYTGCEHLSRTAEVEALVRLSVQFPLRITTEVAARLVTLIQGTPPTSAAPDPQTNSQGVPANPPTDTATQDPLGFTVYRPSKVIGTTVMRLTKRFFRQMHKKDKERIAMVTEGETWAAKETVDSGIQREVEELCTTDPAALNTTRLRAVRCLTSGIGCGIGDGESRQASTPFSPGGDLHETEAAKLYVRLPRASMISLSTPTSAAASSLMAGLRSTEGEEDVFDGRLVANSLLVLMNLLHSYHDYMSLFPYLAFDVAARMIELMDAYEGQAAAMVLGAKAVTKGTLSTITTQHLCVASQCVCFLLDFIPALQTHLTAVASGSVMDKSLRQRAPRDALTVGAALGLLTSPGTSTASTSSGGARGNREAGSEVVKLFIDNDWNRVMKNCRAHRNEFFSKMGSLVYRKVESLGSVAVQKGQWLVGGNEWVMAMLREVARLMRALRPLLPPADMDGVIVPLLGSLCVMLREATMRIPVSAVDDRAATTSDVMLFKANTEKFGYDVLICAEVTSVSAAMQGGRSFAPVSSEEAVLRWFLPPAPSTSAPAAAATQPAARSLASTR